MTLLLLFLSTWALAQDDDADGFDAAQALGSAAWGKPMLARVEDREAGMLLVTLFDDKQQNVNESLVKEGLARVEKTFPKRAAPLVKSLCEKELIAKMAHLGMWRCEMLPSNLLLRRSICRMHMHEPSL